MKKNKVFLPLTALALLVSFGLAACNNGQGGNGGQSQSSQNSGQQEKITITAADGKKNLILGETVQLTASIPGVTWESKNPEVATVSTSGLVTSVGKGSATITASKDGYKEGTISIKVDFETIKITAVGETSLLAGQTVQLNANKDGVTWASNNVEVASVDQTGKVTAIKFGTATITASKDGLNSASIEISVVRPEANAIFDLTTAADHYSADGWWSITTNTYGMSMETGGGATPVTQTQSWGTETPTDTYIGAFGAGDKETIKFSSSKAAKAEIVVNMGNSDEVKLSETMNIKLNDKAIDISNVTLEAHAGDWGNTLTFADLSLGEQDLVSGENVLVFEMLSEAAPYLNELSIFAGDAQVALINPPEKSQIAVEASELKVIIEETVQIVTAVEGVTFVSANEEVATVDGNGLVTGVSVGIVNITLKKEGMYSIRVQIIVNPKPVSGQIVVEAEDAPEASENDYQGYMIMKDGSGWGSSGVHSGGAYVTSFMGSGLSLTLTFNAEKAEKMVLSVVGSAPMSMGGDAAPFVFAEGATITFNEEALEFGEQQFPAPEGYTAEMVEIELCEVDVKAGENTIVFTATGSCPSLDCFKLTPKA